MLEIGCFPDKTKIDDWFYDIEVPRLAKMGKQYVLTEYGVINDGRIYTEKIQELIDFVASNGGGVIVVPPGIYKTGALFFKQGVHLYLSRGAVLLGSDDISDYPLMDTRIEGQSVKYFPALINVDSVDGFTMFGEGTVDGNGLRAWKSFWLRRSWNPDCTNKDEQRPRLVFVSNSSNVTVSGLQLQNSHFWTCHIYKSHRVKFIGCSIYAPRRPIGAPSSDAIDIDACHDVLVKGCRMEVNDDSVVLKGGKGPWANQDSENGINDRIIIEDCEMYYCHGALTCGSESIHNKNIIMQRIKIDSLCNMLWLKMRPDTPQKYEHILIKDVCGSVQSFINIKPWTQFFDLKGREDIPLSHTDSITLCKCDVECETFLDVLPQREQYILSNILIEDSHIIAQKYGLEKCSEEGFLIKNDNIEIQIK